MRIKLYIRLPQDCILDPLQLDLRTRNPREIQPDSAQYIPKHDGFIPVKHTILEPLMWLLPSAPEQTGCPFWSGAAWRAAWRGEWVMSTVVIIGSDFAVGFDFHCALQK